MIATLLLDQYSDALAAYSLRRLSSAYTGPALRIRRVSDGAEQDIGFDDSGLVNTQILEDFCAATDCRVVTWYSQLAGVPDAEQSKLDSQPIIVERGKVVRDGGGYVALRFKNLGSSTPSTHLTVSGMPAYSSHDVTAFIVADNRGSSGAGGWRNLLVFQTPGEPAHKATRLQLDTEGVGNISVGDGTLASTQNTGVPFTLGRFTFGIRARPSTIEGYRNQSLLLSKTHTRSAYFPTGLAIGGDSKGGGAGWDGYISEVILYPSLDDRFRLDIYNNINADWQTGPLEYSTTTLLPQDWDYQIELYKWLRSITLADVEIHPGPLKWDGYLPDVDKFAQLWLSLYNSPKAESATRGKSCWYLLDDGNGCGIEATGQVRLFYKGKPSNTGAYGKDPAFWYQLDIPLSGGGQGNPYFGNPAVARRALIISAVEMMMWDREIERTKGSRNDYYGKALSSWAYVYNHTKDILSQDVRSAFEKGFERFLEHTIRNGAHDINTNMDMFFVYGAAAVYAGVDDPVIKSKAIQAVRRVLFGYVDGDLNGRYDVEEGTFFPAGYIGEADGPETTYNGHSLDQLVGALSWVHDDPAWAFLKEVVRRMSIFKAVQYFRDPPTTVGRQSFYEGPSGYANRTGGSYVRDQGSGPYRDLTAAALLTEARPFIRGYTTKGILRSTAEMAEDVNRRIKTINEAGFATTEVESPPVFRAYSSWPPKRAYLPPEGWYSTLKQLLDSDHPTTYTPYDRPGHYFSTAFGGEQTGTEFWAYKASDGARDFGFFIETDAQQGRYGGWYGGKLEAFWTSETGILILNRHDKTGCDPAGKENSTCWNEVETWAAHHVWGRDENGKAFSTTQIRGRELNRTSQVRPTDPSPNAEVVNVFNDPNATGSHTGEESGVELSGTVTVKNRFLALSNGVLVSHIVDSDGTDQVKELWATLPVFLRWNHKEQWGQAELNDATIEYWNGASWQPLGTSLVATSKLRIGRTYLDGKGARYGYIGFVGEDGASPVNRRVKLSSAVWQQSYQGYARIRNIHIDLHGNPGTVKALPTHTSVSYAITTTEPGTALQHPGPSPQGPGPQSHEVTLVKGWNIVASPVAPSDSSLSAIFGASDQVVLVKDRAGRVYSTTMSVDQIKSWDWREAYMAYAEGEARIRFTGELVPAGTSISLNKGWNLLPYTRSVAGPVSEYLASVIDKAVLVKDEGGGIFDPEHQIDTIQEMQPGEGYWIYMEEPGVLITPP